MGLFNYLSDECFLKLQFKSKSGYKLNLDTPRTFNEKMQWLKLNDHNPLYTTLVDKYKVRKYVAQTIGERYLIPLLGVWDCPSDINFSTLPEQFVLKCNHNSGIGMYICRSRVDLNVKKVRKELKKGLRQNYYKNGREWPYKNVDRKVIAEKYMVDESGTELKDYKFFTFGGKVKYIQVDYDRFINHHRNFYTPEWEYVPFTTCYPTNPNKIIPKPMCLDEMINIAEKLAVEIGSLPFLRVDLYAVKSEVYFGELTFYHGSGYEKFFPEEYDTILGELIKL